MKKRFVRIISLLLSAILLASCNSVLSAEIPSDANVNKMLGFDRKASDYKSKLTENEILSYSSYIDDTGETILATPMVIDIKLPVEWKKAEANIFQTFNESRNSTVLCLKAPSIYKISDGFVLNDNTHARLNTKGVRSDLSGWKNCAYKTAKGYDSTIYYSYNDESNFSIYAYIKLNSEYVIGLNIFDSIENRAQTIDILDTVTLGEYDPYESYTSSNIEGYMSYLVNYFHEPYKKGDDISKINVMYMCLFYAYCNRDMFFDVKEDLGSGVINVSEKRLNEISSALLGDDVLLIKDVGNITEFEEKYLKNGPAAHLYDGVDGRGIGVAYATDHWGGDRYYIDHEEPLEIEEDGNTVKVKASVYYSPDLGVQENWRVLEYTFEKIPVKDNMYDGHIYYQLLEIKEL